MITYQEFIFLVIPYKSNGFSEVDLNIIANTNAAGIEENN